MNTRTRLVKPRVYDALIKFLVKQIDPRVLNLSHDRLTPVLEYIITAQLSNTYNIHQLRDRNLLSRATCTIIRQLRQWLCNQTVLEDQCARALTAADFRGRITVLVDETPLRKYGTTIFATGPVYDSRVKRIVHGLHIVTVMVIVGSLQLCYRFAIYRGDHASSTHETSPTPKAVLAQRILRDLRELPGLKDRIPERAWLVADVQYQRFLTQLPDPYRFAHGVGQVKANRVVTRDSGQLDIETVFKTRPAHYRTVTLPDGREKRVRYKECQLDLVTGGRVRASALWSSHQWRYYVTGTRKARTRTMLSVIKQRWTIEQAFRTMKQHFGLERGYIRKKQSIQAFLTFSGVLFNLFSWFTWRMRRRGISLTIGQAVNILIAAPGAPKLVQVHPEVILNRIQK